MVLELTGHQQRSIKVTVHNGPLNVYHAVRQNASLTFWICSHSRGKEPKPGLSHMWFQPILTPKSNTTALSVIADTLCQKPPFAAVFHATGWH